MSASAEEFLHLRLGTWRSSACELRLDTDTDGAICPWPCLLALFSRSQPQQKCFAERRTASFPATSLQKYLVVGLYHYSMMAGGTSNIYNLQSLSLVDGHGGPLSRQSATVSFVKRCLDFLLLFSCCFFHMFSFLLR